MVYKLQHIYIKPVYGLQRELFFKCLDEGVLLLY